MTTSNNNNRTRALWIGLAYAYLRFAYELVLNLSNSTSVYYLAGLIIGLHGLRYWMSKTTTESAAGETATSNTQLIVLVIICIALAMDAVRFAIAQSS